MSIEPIASLEEAVMAENLLKRRYLSEIGVFGSFACGELAVVELGKAVI